MKLAALVMRMLTALLQAFFDTSTYTAIHANAASWFFYWQACAMLVNVRGRFITW